MNALLLAADQLISEQIVCCLKKRFVRLTIVGTPSCLPLQSDFYCDQFVFIEKLDAQLCQDTLVDLLNETCEQYKIDVVVAGGTVETSILASVASRLTCATVPLPRPDIFQQLNNKASFWRFLEAHGLPHPRTSPITCLHEFDEAHVVAPAVIKPVIGEGNQGVNIARDDEQVKAVRNVLQELGGFPILVQEYIPGSDIDLSVLAVDGEIRAWTVQTLAGPTSLNFTTNDEVLRIGSEIIRHADYSGVAHMDMRLDERDGSIKVIEFNPRFWFTVAASMDAGVNFPYLAACLALGKPFPTITYCETTLTAKRFF